MNTCLQENIKKQLIEKNISAAELERRTGIPHAVVNILHGRSKNPSIKTAQAIAKELGCSVEELISEVPSISSSTKNTVSTWDAAIYKQAFEAAYNCITQLQLQPAAAQLSECITEIYNYTIGGQSRNVDQRFVEWLLKKTLA